MCKILKIIILRPKVINLECKQLLVCGFMILSGLKFEGISIVKTIQSESSCKGNAVAYDYSNFPCLVSQLRILICSAPEQILYSNDAFFTISSKASFSVTIAYDGNFQLVASAQNYETTYSDLFKVLILRAIIYCLVLEKVR